MEETAEATRWERIMVLQEQKEGTGIGAHKGWGVVCNKGLRVLLAMVRISV